MKNNKLFFDIFNLCAVLHCTKHEIIHIIDLLLHFRSFTYNPTNGGANIAHDASTRYSFNFIKIQFLHINLHFNFKLYGYWN